MADNADVSLTTAQVTLKKGSWFWWEGFFGPKGCAVVSCSRRMDVLSVWKHLFNPYP